MEWSCCEINFSSRRCSSFSDCLRSDVVAERKIFFLLFRGMPCSRGCINWNIRSSTISNFGKFVILNMLVWNLWISVLIANDFHLNWKLHFLPLAFIFDWFVEGINQRLEILVSVYRVSEKFSRHDINLYTSISMSVRLSVTPITSETVTPTNTKLGGKVETVKPIACRE